MPTFLPSFQGGQRTAHLRLKFSSGPLPAFAFPAKNAPTFEIINIPELMALVYPFKTTQYKK